MNITFANQQFWLDASGILIWPAQKIAVAADLHLEKASYFAARGQMLPPYDSIDTLQKLFASIQQHDVETLILLGDSFHDGNGYHRLEIQSKTVFENLCRSYKIIWVIGNHDDDFIPPDTQGVNEITRQGITFRHQALAHSQAENFYHREPEISGHFHPKAELHLQGVRVSRPCFIADNQRMILPAFGTFTGGLNINDPAISNLFGSNFTAYLLGDSSVYSVPDYKFVSS